MGKIKENAFWIIFTVIISSGGSLLLGNYNNRNNTIKNAAPKEYVDKQDNVIKDKIIEQKEHIEKELDKKADKDVVEDMKENVKDIRDTQKEMNRMIFDIWKTRNK